MTAVNPFRKARRYQDAGVVPVDDFGRPLMPDEPTAAPSSSPTVYDQPPLPPKAEAGEAIENSPPPPSLAPPSAVSAPPREDIPASGDVTPSGQQDLYAPPSSDNSKLAYATDPNQQAAPGPQAAPQAAPQHRASQQQAASQRVGPYPGGYQTQAERPSSKLDPRNNFVYNLGRFIAAWHEGTPGLLNAQAYEKGMLQLENHRAYYEWPR
jgi:hypothetical protein